MILRTRTLKTLSTLLPAGVLGASVALAAAPADASVVPGQSAVAKAASVENVAARLQAIRSGMSAVAGETAAEPDGDPNIVKAWWGNGGWGRWRGRWGNGGWGWRRWHPGWGNGGWGNGGWRNGGWGNFWHNW